MTLHKRVYNASLRKLIQTTSIPNNKKVVSTGSMTVKLIVALVGMERGATMLLNDRELMVALAETLLAALSKTPSTRQCYRMTMLWIYAKPQKKVMV